METGKKDLQILNSLFNQGGPIESPMVKLYCNSRKHIHNKVSLINSSTVLQSAALSHNSYPYNHSTTQDKNLSQHKSRALLTVIYFSTLVLQSCVSSLRCGKWWRGGGTTNTSIFHIHKFIYS
jgi:hypothetical protein